MKKVGLKAVILALFLIGSGNAFAQNFTVSGGFALSALNVKASGYSGNVKGDVGAGGNIFLDYLLPIKIPMSLGLEVGIDSSSFTTGLGGKDTVLAIPILLRVAYHFDLMAKLDLYLVGKIGLGIGVWNGDAKNSFDEIGAEVENPIGVGFGFDVGVAYYFNSKIGLFAEGGFDDYALSTKISGGGESVTLDVPFFRFFTIGISAKF